MKVFHPPQVLFHASNQAPEMRVGEGTAKLLSTITDLPGELVQLIQNGTNAQYLNAVTSVAGDAKYTDRFLSALDFLLVEVIARWTKRHAINDSIPLFGRILQNAPYLAEVIQAHLSRCSTTGCILLRSQDHDETSLLEILLGLHRLLVFDDRAFRTFINPVDLQTLFDHQSRAVRYLAIRCLGLHLRAADAALKGMIQAHLGGDAVLGQWEAKTIDYRFFSLWEEQRYKHLASANGSSSTPRTVLPFEDRALVTGDWSVGTVELGDTLLPQQHELAHPNPGAGFVMVPTAEANLRSLAQALLQPQPVLVEGPEGSGKTLLLKYAAGQLGKLRKLITLHLNEQSDAKLLVGMYTTGSTPGTFTWQAGVLTTAVMEGHWVLIEDVDRAPNEVLSTLLPLIEKRELLIPSRGQVLRAAPGFRLLATTSSKVNTQGKAIDRTVHMLGARLWTRITIRGMSPPELRTVIEETFPALREHISNILAVFDRLLDVQSTKEFTSRARALSNRAITPRELLRWCGRMDMTLQRSRQFDETTQQRIFLDAVDCFAAATPTTDLREDIAAIVAKELQIPPNIYQHLLYSRSMKDEYRKHDGTLRIGRAILERQRRDVAHRTPAQSRPFSHNDHSLRLLEQIAVAVQADEPLLLVGETGTGKTTVIQHLADQIGRKLVPFNLSQQSESGDLLGGFKPVNIRSIMVPLKDEFDELFAMTFGQKKNQSFVEMLGKYFAKAKWKQTCKLWRGALEMYANMSLESPTVNFEEGPAKRQKLDRTNSGQSVNDLKPRWEHFAHEVQQIEARLAAGSDALAFSFVEGTIVKAVRNGDWVLLDEINLASSDTLEALADLFASGADANRSIMLTETGSIERVQAHPNFRIFAAMNPATDVGKKDLPVAIRSRFTEIYVSSPDGDARSLQSIVASYLSRTNDPHRERLASDVTKLYQAIQSLSTSNALVDGAGHKPHYSLRTLTRCLLYALDTAPSSTLRRALLEGFHMSFSTLLDARSDSVLTPLIWHHLYSQHSNARAELSRPLKMPDDGRQHVQVGDHWLLQGPLPIAPQPQYIITPSVQRNLRNLIRAASTRRFPVLIQGPTSAGKTSMIEYLANASGNRFLRINNHEHTDLQEYLGTYVSGVDGKLEFQEGVLVKALREGDWIVLDELNLAPSDVLEALNRLLDDNRELLVPETQEVIRPHVNFMLFATQNPAGLYGGRKVLSRAFRNRFLELHFDDIPVNELLEILEKRTLRPKSWCKHMVAVYKELSSLRQETRMFEQRSFATLRDLFRWAQREADSKQQLALNGFMLLGERVRKPEERKAVAEVIERIMSIETPRVRIDVDRLYSVEGLSTSPFLENTADLGVVWTTAMLRLYQLVAHAIRNNEPVLLIGETGCGKTTVCQLLAAAAGRKLHILNAHQNTETGDIIGAQRPIRNRGLVEQQLRVALSAVTNFASSGDMETTSVPQILQHYDNLPADRVDQISADQKQNIELSRRRWLALFEWADGPLVEAMKQGDFFLLDEISLADDSVLERLNSVLESQRTILLAEKGSADSYTIAQDGFQFLATMNPGGDFGKRELSPALRNRFTEIWVPALSSLDDILQITQARLQPAIAAYAEPMVIFARWFNTRYNSSSASSVSIRDMLAWIAFANRFAEQDAFAAVVHGAAMVFIDTLGANPAALLSAQYVDIDSERQQCLAQLSSLLGRDATPDTGALQVSLSAENFSIGPFHVEVAARSSVVQETFSLEAPTAVKNAMRILRGMQVSKPILLEGSPGVGKTTLVTAIASITGRRLERINLSEQTDLMDLFGSDTPVEGEQAGKFEWKDGPFLTAMKRGDWVLLDEMNLASQSVLEGLNACLDHRGEVYISELDQTFRKHSKFRLFAAQNPHHQGGGRKGLPASFVNRFTVVYADIFGPEDLLIICGKVAPHVDETVARAVVGFTSDLERSTTTHRAGFGSQGSPWEFNLRDILRWLQLRQSPDGYLAAATPYDLTDIVFRSRFRNASDKAHVDRLIQNHFPGLVSTRNFYHNVDEKSHQVGFSNTSRPHLINRAPTTYIDINNEHLPILEILMLCTMKAWPVVLVGSSGSGKTTLIEQLASFAGAEVTVLPLHADIDATDLVGGFEQVDASRTYRKLTDDVRIIFTKSMIAACCDSTSTQSHEAMSQAAKDIEKLDRDDMTDQNLKALQALIHAVKRVFGINNEDLLRRHELLCSDTMHSSGPRFQWVDGALIESMQEGTWLVLDNANLCSSSVLDRLNSLLEPDGYLTVSEHSDASGEARVIRPHPGFRIFITMDPRHGELSRAMRNRTVELYLERSDLESSGRRPITFIADSSVSRFRNFSLLEHDGLRRTSVASSDLLCDHVSMLDTLMSQSFQEQLCIGLFDVPSTCAISFDRIQKLPSILADAILSMYAEVNRRQVGETFETSPEPVHPLNNVALVQTSTTLQQRAAWLGFLFATSIVVSDMTLATDAVRKRASRGTAMTQLERRLKSTQIGSKSAATVLAAAKLLATVPEYLQSKLVDENQYVTSTHAGKDTITDLALESHYHWLYDVQGFWQTLFEVCDRHGLEEASITAVLAVGQQQVLASGRPTMLPGSEELSAAFKSATASQGLETGQTQSQIWTVLAPKLPSTESQMRDLAELEALTRRFASAAVLSGTSLDAIIEQLLRLQEVANSVCRGLADASNVIESLRVMLEELPSSTTSSARTPHLQSTFLSLLTKVRSDRSSDVLPSRTMAKLQVLASFHGSASTASKLPPCVQDIVHTYRVDGMQLDALGPLVQEDFHQTFLREVSSTNASPLLTLGLINTEMTVLGQAMGTYSVDLCRPDSNILDKALRDMLSLVVSMHAAVTPESLRFWVDQSLLTEIHEVQNDFIDANVSALLLEGCTPAADYLNSSGETRHARLTTSASAWLSLAATVLRLYIPSQAADPVLLPQVAKRMFLRKRGSLLASLEALESVEVGLNGRSTNLRIQQTQRLLSSIGTEPRTANIARPDVSQIDAIAEDFRAVLRLVDSVMAMNPLHAGSAEVELKRRNLSQLMKRLLTSYMCYDDLLLPATSFLACLDIGLALTQQARAARSVSLSSDLPLWSRLVDATPGLKLMPRPRFADNMDDGDLGVLETSAQMRFQLQQLDLLVEQRHLRSSDHQNKLTLAVSDIFGTFYKYWKIRLADERRTEAANSSLYTYRGGQTDEDDIAQAELESLFPDYEREPETLSTESPQSISPRDLANRLSEAHRRIFEDGVPKNSTLAETFTETFAALAGVKELQDLSSLITVEDAYPALLLRLHQQRQGLEPQSGNQPDFYYGHNAEAASKIHKLASDVERKFAMIHDRWPEHATPIEVLRIVEGLFAMQLDTPVAKLLTKVEKLHATIHEWQRITSREFSAATHYDELTKLIINWRQLELRAWSRLLDGEVDRAREEARSWWFVVYENLLVAPEALLESGQEQALLHHLPDLLRTLKDFTVAAPMGQLEERVSILKTMERHLAQRAVADERYKSILSAIRHFLSYLIPFLPSVKRTVLQGRSLLEKDINEVIRLASWKDTTIEALRQSAKKSHRKLFRLVRKFRDILLRSSEPLFGDWPQAATPPRVEGVLARLRNSADTATHEYPVISEQRAPAWAQRPSRFRNVEKTIDLMQALTRENAGLTSARTTLALQDFVVNVAQSAKELQKATPQYSTKENAEDIKHLRARKRRLFADVLKALREMGLKSNVSSSTISSQSSVVLILASLQCPISLPDITCDSPIPSHPLYQLLHLMDQVRSAVREHSTDLTSAEVARSLAYSESLLQVTIQQYNSLSSHVEATEKLDTQLKALDTLKSSSRAEMSIWTQDKVMHNADLTDRCVAVATLLDFLLEAVKAQFRLRGLAEDGAVHELQQWPPRLRKQAGRLVDIFSSMPTLKNTTRREALQTTMDELASLKGVLDRILMQQPQLGPILRRLLPWLEVIGPNDQRSHSTRNSLSIDDLQEKLFAAADMVLSSIQALKAHDTSTDEVVAERSWLISSTIFATQRLRTCGVPQIEHQLVLIIDSIQRLGPDDLSLAADMVANIMPIFQQYRQCLGTLLGNLSELHESSCRLAVQTADLFLLICKKGFCTPPEQSKGEEGKGEDLETGTGLGEGEGAEDISKDIKDDEDLTELAQEPNEKIQDQVEDEKDAVDMADEEMAGQLDDAEDNQEDDASKSDDDQEDMDEQEGNVDDLDPSTVDEKLWDDGRAADTEKEKDGEDGTGKKDTDDVVAGNEDATEGQEQPGLEAAAEEEQEDASAAQNEQVDQTAKEEEPLNLPDDLQMDAKDEAMSDLDDEDQLDDMASEIADEMGRGGSETDTEDPSDEAHDTGDVEEVNDDEQDGQSELANGIEDDKEVQDETESTTDEQDSAEQEKNPANGADNAESDQHGTSGENAMDDNEVDESQQQSQAASSGADGARTEPQEQQTVAAGDGGEQVDSQREATSRVDDDTPEQRAFRKLGDDLQEWFRQNRQIQEARDDAVEKPDMDMTDADFEHLPTDETRADTQALGAATEEQSHALDESKAVDVNETEKPAMPPAEDIEMEDARDEENINATEPAELTDTPGEEADGEESQQRTFVGAPQDRPQIRQVDGPYAEEESQVEEMDTQLSDVHLETQAQRNSTSVDEARSLWTRHEAATRTLALALTEQLRLILEPTLATKMRGDFRTGKRLNIKRIIPYIASQYKRDKIWMRRSVPSKRNYQVMLALDDSKSMAESETIKLAFDTLALVARALTMLEAGECSVVRFGEDVTIAHRFDEPFGAEAGVNVFRQFTFDQGKTDVKTLINRSLDIFRDARSRAIGNGADLWQLQLIISDGVCEDHGTIQRLVRQAQEERIMIVFVIVDAGAAAMGETSDGSRLPPKSITDLQIAEITTDDNGEAKLVRRKYLDTFPFRWWIVVRDIRELPGVLSTALRQWFVEVVDAA